MKKTIYKRVLASVLCVLIVCCSAVCGLGALTAAAYDGWSEAYQDFLKTGKYKNNENVYTGNDGLSGGVRFALHDMDNNGTPELLVDNNAPNFAGLCSVVYAFFGGEVLYAGFGGMICPICMVSTDMNYPGGFAYNCRGGFGTCAYFTLSNNQVTEKTVYTDNGGGDGPYHRDIEDGCEKLTEAFDNAKDLEYYAYNAISAMGWDAFCALYGYTADGTAAEAVSEPAAAPVDGTTAADGFRLSEAQQAALDEFLVNCYYLYFYPGRENEFDCAADVSGATLLEMMLENNGFERFWPDEADNTVIKQKSAGSDPRGAFKDSYEKTSAEQVDWVLKNRFNYTDGDIQSMRDVGENALQAYIAGREPENEPFYESDGYYYHIYNAEPEEQTETTDVRILNCSYTFRDNSMFVEYTVGEYENAEATATRKTSDYFAQLDYKMIDGQRYWSLYKNSHTKFWDVPEPTTESVTESAAQTEADPQNDGTLKIGNLVLDYWTLLLIGLAFIVAVLFIAIIVLAVKNGKRKKARAKKKAALPAQQPAVRSVAMPTPQPEQRQPEPKQKPRPAPKFRYRCNEADRGGKCEMCGTDVGMLMQIDAIKGEKVNTRYFCRNCAARIMRQVEQQQNS